MPMNDRAGRAERYFLKTARLGFRAWREDDLPLAMALWTDVRVTGFFGGPYSPQQVQARLAREMADQRESGMQYWPFSCSKTAGMWAFAACARGSPASRNWVFTSGRSSGGSGWPLRLPRP